MSLFIRHLACPAARSGLALVAALVSCAGDGTDPAGVTAAQPVSAPVSEQTAAIVRGQPAAAGLPSVAAIILRERNAGEDLLAVVCSGTLIAPRVVLTAAHCIDRHGPERAPAGQERLWYVSFQADLTGLGREDLALPPDAIPVTGTRIHSDFSPAENARVGLGPSHDLGLVFLAEPAEDRPPSALPGPEAASALNPGTTVTVAGYGTRSPDGAAAPEDGPGLKSSGIAEVLEVATHELRVGRPDHPTSPGQRSLADKCGGDSGGPTFLDVGEESLLVGLSSRGYDSNPRCDTASVDLRVDLFVPWILEQISSQAAVEATPAPPGCSAGGHAATPAGAPASTWLLLFLALLARRRTARPVSGSSRGLHGLALAHARLDDRHQAGHAGLAVRLGAAFGQGLFQLWQLVARGAHAPLGHLRTDPPARLQRARAVSGDLLQGLGLDGRALVGRRIVMVDEGFREFLLALVDLLAHLDAQVDAGLHRRVLGARHTGHHRGDERQGRNDEP